MNLFSVTANRASAVLYSFLKKYGKGVWLLPVNVCPDVPLTLCVARISFEFVDINKETLCIDERTCLKMLSADRNKYKGIIFVRTYGYLYDNSQFYDACRAIVPDLLIVDDRCLCLPSFNPVTYGADMLLYSTGHCKQIDLGGGGYSFSSKEFCLAENVFYDGTDEELLYKKAYEEDTLLCDIPLGWLKIENYKDIVLYEEIVSALVPRRISQRNTLNSLYRANLKRELQMKDDFQNWRFNIMVSKNQKETILNDLFRDGLFASNHYRCANKLFNRLIYPQATTIFNATLNLFNDNNYTEDMAERTCKIINRVLAEY